MVYVNLGITTGSNVNVLNTEAITIDVEFFA